MIKPLIGLSVLVAGAAYPIYEFLKPPDYGLSPQHPIGEFMRIAEWVQRWDHYDESAGTVSEDLAYAFGGRFEGWKTAVYTRKEQRENGYPRFLSFVLDRHGELWAVHAEFPSKTQEPRVPELSSEQLMATLWKKRSGRDPRFSRDKVDGRVVHVDNFARDGVKGTWTKSYRVPTNERSICDSVQIYRVKEE